MTSTGLLKEGKKNLAAADAETQMVDKRPLRIAHADCCVIK